MASKTRKHWSASPTVRVLALTLLGLGLPTPEVRADAVDGVDLWILGAHHVDVGAGDSGRVVDVLVRADRIVAVTSAGLFSPPEEAERLDGRGLWIAPGAFDAHVHVSATPGLSTADTPELEALQQAYREQAGRSFLRHGFTQVVDLNHVGEDSIAWFGASGPAPDLLHAGTGLTMANGYPLNWLPEAERWSYPNFLVDPSGEGPEIPAEVVPTRHTPEAAIGRVADRGAVAVKVFWESGFGGFTDLPTPSRATLDRIVAEAHSRGLPVVAHANSLAAWDFVTQSQIDALVHGLWNWRGEPGADDLPPRIRAVVDRSVLRGIALMPTTRVLGGLADLFDPGFLDDPRVAEVYPAALLGWLRTGGGDALREEIRGEDFDGSTDDAAIRRQFLAGRAQGDRVLRAFVHQGGLLVFGSDTPSGPLYTNPPGLNARLELEHLAELGLDPLVVARSLTVAPARLFGIESDYGEVAVGRRANLLLLRSDPLESIEAWGDIERVVVGGEVWRPESLRADR